MPHDTKTNMGRVTEREREGRDRGESLDGGRMAGPLQGLGSGLGAMVRGGSSKRKEKGRGGGGGGVEAYSLLTCPNLSLLTNSLMAWSFR